MGDHSRRTSWKLALNVPKPVMEQNQLCTLTVAKTLSRLWMGRTLGIDCPSLPRQAWRISPNSCPTGKPVGSPGLGSWRMVQFEDFCPQWPQTKPGLLCRKLENYLTSAYNVPLRPDVVWQVGYWQVADIFTSVTGLPWPPRLQVPW